MVGIVVMIIQSMVVVVNGIFIKVNHSMHIRKILRQRLVIQTLTNPINNLRKIYIKTDKKQVGGHI